MVQSAPRWSQRVQPAVPAVAQSIVDPNCNSYVLVDKRATDLAEKLEILQSAPLCQVKADGVVQAGLNDVVAKVSSHTSIILRIANAQTLWEKLLLYGKALTMLRDASSKVNDFIDAIGARRPSAETIESIAKLLNCMTHCLAQVDAMRKRIRFESRPAHQKAQRTTAPPTCCARRCSVPNAPNDTKSGHRELAVGLYQQTRSMLP